MSTEARRPQSPPQHIPRMKIASITKGKLDVPHRITVYGVEKIGKSTFAAGAPDPVFLGAEDGTAHLDVARFPLPTDMTWEDVNDGVEELANQKHSFKTLVIDTLDWMEPILWRWMCMKDGEPDITGTSKGSEYGYAKGYDKAVGHWRTFLASLERLQRIKKMHVVLLAHAQVKTFKNPEGPDFDRYTMKLNDKACAVVKEWSEAVLFANHTTLTAAGNDKGRSEKEKRYRGQTDGRRVLYTERRGAFDAGNRYSLPAEMELSWDAYWDAASGTEARVQELRAFILGKARDTNMTMLAETEKWIGLAGNDMGKLMKLDNWLNNRIDNQQPATTGEQKAGA